MLINVLLLIFVTEFSQFLLALSPVRINLHIKAEEDFLLEEILHVDARLCAHLLQRLSSLSDDDALLGVAHHVDHSADVISFSTFLELLHHNLAAVRDLLLVVQEDLFAYDLRSEETEVLVCEDILVILCRCSRQIAYDSIEYVVKVELLLC